MSTTDKPLAVGGDTPHPQDKLERILVSLYNSACPPGRVKPGYPPIHMYEAKQAILELIRQAQIEEAKYMERALAKEFDDLVIRVRTDPNFGNSTKNKKDNFLDGAECMLLLPSIRIAQLKGDV